ncbi:MAG: hypothetical protein ACK5MG_06445 [Bacteroidales bacterium]
MIELIKNINKSSVFISLLILVVLCSCDWSQFNYSREDGVVARVDNVLLTDSDLDYYLTRSATEDSFAYNARKELFVKQWIQDQLLFDMAMSDKVISADQIRRMTDAYVKQIVLSAYKNNLFAHDSLKVNISNDEIESFYALNKNDFRLEDYLAKGAYISYPVAKTSQMQPILRKLRMGGDQNYKEALDMCNNIVDFSVDIKIPIFMSAGKVRVFFPKYANNSSLRGYSRIENNNEGRCSILYIQDTWNKGEIAPLVYYNENIKELLRYQKKKKHIEDLERRTYVNAVKNKKAEIYDN